MIFKQIDKDKVFHLGIRLASADNDKARQEIQEQIQKEVESSNHIHLWSHENPIVQKLNGKLCIVTNTMECYDDDIKKTYCRALRLHNITNSYEFKWVDQRDLTKVNITLKKINHRNLEHGKIYFQYNFDNTDFYDENQVGGILLCEGRYNLYDKTHTLIGGFTGASMRGITSWFNLYEIEETNCKEQDK